MSGLGHLAGANALVVGDVMLDEYLWGDVERISPEAPVPVVAIHGRSRSPGGAANVAACITSLGGSVRLAGVLGDDEGGEVLQKTLVEHGLDVDGVLMVAGRTTTTKTRVIARSQQVVRTDTEERAGLDERVESELVGWARTVIDAVDVVVLSDYAKGVVTPALSQNLIGLARDRGKPVVVDPKGTDYAKYRGAFVITPNAHDVEKATNVRLETPDDLREIGRRLRAVVPGTRLLITRGAHGMSLLSDDGTSLDIPAVTEDVFDITGAGDTVVATLAVCLARGVGLDEALKLANAAAGVTVRKLGTAIVSLLELEAALGEQ